MSAHGEASWLDLPIRSRRGCGRSLNPQLDGFWQRLSGRSKALFLKAALGKLPDRFAWKLDAPPAVQGASGSVPPVSARRRPWRRRPPPIVYRPPVRTLREFSQLPARAVLLQRGYGHKTYLDLYAALRACGVAEPMPPAPTSP